MIAMRALTLVLATSLLAACESDPTGTEQDEVIDCGPEVTSVDVTVSAGLSPVIDWTPRCRVTLLLIEEGAHDVWSLRGEEDSNDVPPPVTYGTVPDGLTGPTAEPLVAGGTYEVILWHAVNGGDRLLAVHEFTR